MDLQERLGRARTCLRAGEWAEAIGHAEQALQAATVAGDDQAEGWGHLHAGIAHAGARAWPDAEGHLLRALAHMDRDADLARHRGRALYHLALTYEYSREVRLAITVYDHAEATYREEGYARGRVMCLLNAAWLELMEERRAAAERRLDFAMPLLREAGPEWTPAHTALHALLAYRQGDAGAACALACEVLEASGHPWAGVLALAVAGLLAADAGEAERAAGFLRQSEDQLPAANDPRLHRLLGELSARIFR